MSKQKHIKHTFPPEFVQMKMERGFIENKVFTLKSILEYLSWNWSDEAVRHMLRTQNWVMHAKMQKKSYVHYTNNELPRIILAIHRLFNEENENTKVFRGSISIRRHKIFSDKDPESRVFKYSVFLDNYQRRAETFNECRNNLVDYFIENYWDNPNLEALEDRNRETQEEIEINKLLKKKKQNELNKS